MISLTEFNQLMKFPLLIDHFFEHKEKDDNLSLWKFLNMHYAYNKAKDSDYAKDTKLPFKSHNAFVNSIIIAYIPSNSSSLDSKSVYVEQNNYSDFVEDLNASAYFSSIWQPPKAC